MSLEQIRNKLSQLVKLQRQYLDTDQWRRYREVCQEIDDLMKEKDHILEDSPTEEFAI